MFISKHILCLYVFMMKTVTVSTPTQSLPTSPDNGVFVWDIEADVEITRVCVCVCSCYTRHHRVTYLIDVWRLRLWVFPSSLRMCVCVCVLTRTIIRCCVCVSFILNSFVSVLAAGCSLTRWISDEWRWRLLTSVCVLHDGFHHILKWQINIELSSSGVAFIACSFSLFFYAVYTHTDRLHMVN